MRLPTSPARGPIVRAVLIFGLAAIASLAVVWLATFAGTRTVAYDQALDDAQRRTEAMAVLTFPAALERAFAGDDAALQDAVSARIEEGYLSAVLVRDGDGTLVYSSLGNTGSRHPLPDAARAAIEEGTVTSERADQDELRWLPTATGYLEVYAPLSVPGHGTYAIEVYFDDAGIEAFADVEVSQMLPIMLVPLMSVQLIMVAVFLWLVRRARRQERERAELLEFSISASDRERERIAGDIHDGPIQELAGVGFVLDAAKRVHGDDQERLLDAAHAALRRAATSLRTLMADIYPPDLHSVPLKLAITRLVETTVPVEVAATVDVDDMPPLGDEAIELVYRIVREALGNVAKHSGAATVRVEVGMSRFEETSKDAVRVRVTDDGVGIDGVERSPRQSHHVGLRLIRDRVRSVGGTVQIGSGPDGGTDVVAFIPLPAPAPKAARRRSGAAAGDVTTAPAPEPVA
ncbi:sensor histidine kinase [Microbacterium hominis]|uniref:Histidine kinase/HSP90-like ATPase domain-containing protein n=1 Tax=Microbacterium hominis TaxID=162426 RepID=A0A7D4TEZ3_9MICO|nr:ATP-binding protein [Microbacterium hominis]QKJ18301.1 hypothetical protein HQM25_02050 [Microbacterium hominis]